MKLRRDLGVMHHQHAMKAVIDDLSSRSRFTLVWALICAIRYRTCSAREMVTLLEKVKYWQKESLACPICRIWVLITDLGAPAQKRINVHCVAQWAQCFHCNKTKIAPTNSLCCVWKVHTKDIASCSNREFQLLFATGHILYQCL